MNHIIVNHNYKYEIEKLIRVFLPNEKINTTEQSDGDERYIKTTVDSSDDYAVVSAELSLKGVVRKGSEEVKRENEDDYQWQTHKERRLAVVLYNLLSAETSYIPPWGILTGIRPSKLMYSFCRSIGEEKAKEYFINELLVSPDKTELAYTVAKNEEIIMKKSTAASFSLYVSIPFCPSRCSYCSFVSHSNEAAKKLIPDYLEKLTEELRCTAEITKELGLKLESVYFGGGTPTSLEADELKLLTDAVEKYFSPDETVEYTIESGRPDSITKQKLEVIKNCGAKRISINPQTFNDDVLKIIGRKHTSRQTIDAMNLARECGFENINMDLIAGLPSDTIESFASTLDTVISLKPENVTVHTLALKRSSGMVTDEMAVGEAKNALLMLDLASKVLTKEGYMPYYMYRQSKCLGNLENVGWAKPGFECEYNIQMMEETHTVLAVGAGAVSKLKHPETGYIERIFNYKYPFEYLNDFNEILRRKERIKTFYKES